MKKQATCKECGTTIEAVDLSDLFEDEPAYTCDECYQRIQAEGRAAAAKVAAEYDGSEDIA